MVSSVFSVVTRCLLGVFCVVVRLLCGGMWHYVSPAAETEHFIVVSLRSV